MALVAALMVGSVALCQFALTKKLDVQLTRDVDTHDESSDAGSEKNYRVELTFGFSAAEDPFALDAGRAGSKRVLVEQNGNTLLEWTQDVSDGQTLVVSNVFARQKAVELFIEAIPSPGEAQRPVPLRVQLFQGTALCDEQTLWSHGDGQPVASIIVLKSDAGRLTVDRGLSNAGE